MKLQTAVLIASALVLGACGFRTKEIRESDLTPEVASPTATKVEPKALDAKGHEIMADPKFKDSLGKIERGNYELSEHIQAGSLVFAGVSASETTPHNLTVDQRIDINQESQLNFTRAISDEEISVMNEVIGLNTYINVGCSDINPALIAGLTRIKPKMQHGYMHVHAKKVFICAKNIVQEKNAIVYADELVLNGTSFGFAQDGGLINICAKTLTLIGDSRINTSIKNADSADQLGSPLFLTVIKEIKGTGSLSLNKP